MILPLWLKRIIGILQVGGGAVGIVALLQSIFSGQVGLLSLGFAAVVLLFYAYGIAMGAQLLECPTAGVLFASEIYWLLQIPAIMSRPFGYFLVSGFHLTPYLALGEHRPGINFLLGSFFQFSMGKPVPQAWLGVNVFALAVALLLHRARRPAWRASAVVTAATTTPAAESP